MSSFAQRSSNMYNAVKTSYYEMRRGERILPIPLLERIFSTVNGGKSRRNVKKTLRNNKRKYKRRRSQNMKRK
jgi:hypothetical protein